MLFHLLASTVDAFHALLMGVWVVGMPLLFWHRWPRLSRAYGAYAITFVALSQASRLWLGECFFTTISRWLWELRPGLPRENPGEWFTVRFAYAVFHLAPSHRAITVVSEALVVITAIGVLFTMRRARAHNLRHYEEAAQS